ncbi:putative colanic acid biosynthesis acetyltransferase [Methylosinus sp. Sm6]|uniref:putative colanic acid biosynthesis acetyltransferase n=1 Tax=Methylosinus sp. Sm6 TaxID=2866948 RepID=UPI001C99D630|nr:putative colanic acid biosynthesis acetyltransferase [Methylosinus sp. Sm6]MBY6243411.1 putative colanic acid biosynthesis acetyltransferase [Methylosinus sp. Sm6]
MNPLDAAKYKPCEGGPSFGLANRMFRAVWTLTWLSTAAWTPPFMNRWRCFLLRLFGAQLAASSAVRGSVKIWYPPNLIMGENASLGPRVICYNMASIRVEKGAIISQGAHLCAGTHDLDDPNFQLVAKPIVIGPYAWIAAEAFVGPGVAIGEGAVLGARAVAMRNLERWKVYAGNPAREKRARTPRCRV